MNPVIRPHSWYPGVASRCLGLTSQRLPGALLAWRKQVSWWSKGPSKIPAAANQGSACPLTSAYADATSASKSASSSASRTTVTLGGTAPGRIVGHRHFPRHSLPSLPRGSITGSPRRAVVTSAVEPHTSAATTAASESNTSTGSGTSGGSSADAKRAALNLGSLSSPASASLGLGSGTAREDVAASLTSSPGRGGMDNSSTIASMDWNDWMMSASSSSSSSDSGDVAPLMPPFERSDGGGLAATASGASGAAAAAAASQLPADFSSAAAAATIRISFYAVASSFDRRQLETRLRAAYGSQVVRKYPDVIHCQLSRSREAQPGTDVFFFDYGVVACWGLAVESERDIVQNLAVQCAVQPLSERDQERDVFRCTFATNPADALEQSGSTAATAATTKSSDAFDVIVAAPAAAAPAGGDALGSILDTEYGTCGSLGSTSGTTSTRRYTRRAERSGGAVAVVAAAAAPPPPPPLVEPEAQAPPLVAEGPYSLLSFPPKISDDTVLLHVRQCGDTAALLAVSYALAQSTKLSAFEKAVENIVAETQGLPEALAEHGEVHLSGKEIGRLIGKVFVLKRSVNLLGSVAGTPEFFWYAPDHLQSLYTSITAYVELTERVEQLNGRFDVLQEMLELLRDQEANRHGNRLEWIVIWLIVVEVVLGVFELLELFGVIGPKNGGGF